MKKLKLKQGEILVLKNVKNNMTSHNGFKWPKKGIIEAPDWKDDYKCGNGLHGLPWGVGDVNYFYREPSVWLVIKVNTMEGYKHGKDAMIDKCKFRRGEVIYCGDRNGAVELITRYAPKGLPINYISITGGDGATVMSGYESFAAGGDYSIVEGGNNSTVKAGNNSIVKGGHRSFVTGGNYSKVIGGNCSEVTGGDYSVVTGGYKSKVIGGKYSIITGDRDSTVIGDDGSKLKGGYGSMLICKTNGKVNVKIIDSKSADKFFTVENGKWVEVEEMEKNENESY